MEPPKYSRRELTKEEAEDLGKDLSAVLEKYDAEMEVESRIKLWKRVAVTEVKEEQNIPSPFILDGDQNPETNTNPTPA